MNEKFLDKFFRILSVISALFAEKNQLRQFLISSYYMNAPLLYPYEYVDFNLYCCKLRGNVKLNTRNDIMQFLSVVVLEDSSVDSFDCSTAILLYEIYYKINNDISNITENDVLNLNKKYKELNGLS